MHMENYIYGLVPREEYIASTASQRSSSPSSHERFVSLSRRTCNYVPLSEIKRQQQRSDNEHEVVNKSDLPFESLFSQLSQPNDVRNVVLKNTVENICEPPTTEYASFLDGGMPTVNKILLQEPPSVSTSRKYVELPQHLNLESSPINKREKSLDSDEACRTNSRKRSHQNDNLHDRYRDRTRQSDNRRNSRNDFHDNYRDNKRNRSSYNDDVPYRSHHRTKHSTRENCRESSYSSEVKEERKRSIHSFGSKEFYPDVGNSQYSRQNSNFDHSSDESHNNYQSKHVRNFNRYVSYEQTRTKYEDDYSQKSRYEYNHPVHKHDEMESFEFDSTRVKSPYLRDAFEPDAFIDVSRDSIGSCSQSRELESMQSSTSREKRQVFNKKECLSYEEYSKLAEKFDEQRKQLADVKQEITRLKRQEGELLRKNRWVADVHNDPEVLRINSLLCDLLKEEEKLTKNVADLKAQVQLHSYDYGQSKQKKTSKSDIQYVYKDAGRYWCELCNIINDSLSQVFKHLRSTEHLQKFKACEAYPWTTRLKTPRRSKVVELPCIKGVEFLMPAEALYCQICQVFLGDNKEAELHLRSKRHHDIYDEHISKFPSYEKALEESINLTLEKQHKANQRQRYTESDPEKIIKENDAMDCQVSSSSKDVCPSSGKSSQASRLFQKVKPKASSLKIDLNLNRSSSIRLSNQNNSGGCQPSTSSASTIDQHASHQSVNNSTDRDKIKINKKTNTSIPENDATPLPLDEFIVIEPTESGADNQTRADYSSVDEGLIESSSESEHMSDFEVIEECD